MSKSGFTGRVASERRTLRLLNASIPGAKLNGLTLKAIEKWATSNECVTDSLRTQVEAIARRIRVDADSSQDVFRVAGERARSSFDLLLGDLEESLKRGSER